MCQQFIVVHMLKVPENYAMMTLSDKCQTTSREVYSEVVTVIVWSALEASKVIKSQWFPVL